MDREKGDGNTILLTVIGVATLLVALVGATFAYFSATVDNNQNQSVNITTAPPVGLQYVGKQFALTNIIPSDAAQNEAEQGTFTVTNPGTSTTAQKYDLTLHIDQNTLETKEVDGTTPKELELIITSTSATIDTTLASAANITAVENGLSWDLTNGTATNGQAYKFINQQRIEIGATQTYNMTLNFIETGTNQNHNQGKNFKAHVEISNPVSVK